MNIRLGTQTRESLDDDRTDYKQFHYFKEKKMIVAFSSTDTVFWKVDNNEKITIDSKKFLKIELKVKAIYPVKDDVMLVMENDEIIHYNVFEDKIISRIPDFDLEVSSLIIDNYKPTVKILSISGDLVIWDYIKHEKIYETKILLFSELLFAF